MSAALTIRVHRNKREAKADSIIDNAWGIWANHEKEFEVYRDEDYKTTTTSLEAALVYIAKRVAL
jgi:hypothetical protein